MKQKPRNWKAVKAAGVTVFWSVLFLRELQGPPGCGGGTAVYYLLEIKADSPHLLFLQYKWRSADRTTVFSKREPSSKLVRVMLENALSVPDILRSRKFFFFIFYKRFAR